MKRKLVVLLVVLFIANLGIVNAYTWPTEGTVTSGFRTASRPSHEGIDIPATTGTPCYAVGSGKVVAAGTYGDGSYGNMVIIDIGGKTVSYSHLSKINVSVGQTVSEGQIIGLVGSTGRSSGAHLHFEVKNGSVGGSGGSAYSQYCGMNSEVDPVTFLNGATQTNSGTTQTNSGATQTNSGATQTNKCNTCGGIINGNGVCTNCMSKTTNTPTSTCSICGSPMEAFYPSGSLAIYTTPYNTHYIACKANHSHQVQIGAHNTTGECAICGRRPLNRRTEVNISCSEPDCMGIVTTEFYYTDDGTHYRACNLNHDHQYFIEEHFFSVGRCVTCGYGEVDSIFTDLPKDHWAYADVKAMKEAGILESSHEIYARLGTNGIITAEELIVMLARMVENKGLTKNEGELYLVNEMGGSSSYDSYIALIRVLGNANDSTKKLGETEMKLILGNSDEEVLENYRLPVTREQVANLLGAVLEAKYGNDMAVSSTNELNAKDWDEVNSIYKKRINQLAKKNIFRGSLNGDGTININPKLNISKVEAIALLNRLYTAL